MSHLGYWWIEVGKAEYRLGLVPMICGVWLAKFLMALMEEKSVMSALTTG